MVNGLRTKIFGSPADTNRCPRFQLPQNRQPPAKVCPVPLCRRSSGSLSRHRRAHRPSPSGDSFQRQPAAVWQPSAYRSPSPGRPKNRNPRRSHRTAPQIAFPGDQPPFTEKRGRERAFHAAESPPRVSEKPPRGRVWEKKNAARRGTGKPRRYQSPAGAGRSVNRPPWSQSPTVRRQPTAKIVSASRPSLGHRPPSYDRQPGLRLLGRNPTDVPT